MTPDQAGQPPRGRDPELLAPAGDWAALEAALEAGADAVYLGLQGLNARRRARNFPPDEFARAVAAAHARGARLYLTLNTDLCERELGEAARSLELARGCGADAVLVRDPALLALRTAFPELEFHMSTQAGMTSGADVEAAAELGAERVVLARELALPEIAEASSVPGARVEAFVQGALCFSVSGRCLLASWAGGRSGNRGACTSPCRVPWSVGGDAGGTPLSMKDLSAWDRLDDLRAAGVAALKIEGRLKNAAWVRAAVGLYRRALAGDSPRALALDAARLGTYAGREQTCGYLDGRRRDLTGLSGRKPGAALGEEPAQEPGKDESVYDLEIAVRERFLVLRCAWAGRSREWELAKTAVRRQRKAVALRAVLERLGSEPVQGLRLGRGQVSDPDFALPPRAANALVGRLSIELRLMRKKPEGRVRVELPAAVRELLAAPAPSADNRFCLGDPPDRVRLEAGQVEAFSALMPPGGAIVEGLSAGALEGMPLRHPLVAALPQVFFARDVPSVQELLRACGRLGLAVEVNSWGGWHLARKAGVAMESGPGLPVLNSLAARHLAGLGVSCVTLSLEADRRQLEDVCARAPASCAVVVYGRPALVTTRVEIPEDRLEKVFADRRGTRMRPRREGGVWVFRPVEPFDWRGLRNGRIRARHLVMDLSGCADPAAQWRSRPEPGAFLFNYERGLY